jgi:hypothetical protein
MYAFAGAFTALMVHGNGCDVGTAVLAGAAWPIVALVSMKAVEKRNRDRNDRYSS